MASYHQIQHNSRAPFESPAKIFAKLKSKLKQRPSVEDFSDEDCRAAEIHGGQFTPNRRTERHSKDFSPLQALGSGEVTAVTLSPISSPPKRLQCRTDREPLFNHARMPRRTPLMESTALCNTSASRSHTEAFHPRTGDAGGFVVCGPGDVENAGPPHFISPNSVFSPMRKRLRKRKSDDQLLNKSDLDCVRYPAKERKISPAFREDVTSTRNVEPFPRDITVTPEHNGCAAETLPQSLMTPAKMFAYLKERESQREQCDVPLDTPSPRPERDPELQSETRVGPDTAASRVDRLQSSDNESNNEDFPHDSPQPVLLEDPLVLNSPRFSIPKTQESVCRRTKWSHCITFPTENVIHLRKWFIRGRRKGLFVDGIHRENNIPWNSNIISDRVSSSVLKTVSGRVYILVGRMDLDAPSVFPKWFLKRFVRGFPSDWKELHEKYLLESKGNLKKSSVEENEKRGQRLKAKSQQQMSMLSQSSASSSKVSRSGRLIKPPLDYWKGGRVVLDAHMNVTVHDSYDTIIQPEITSSTKSFIPSKPDKHTASVMVPLNKVCDQRESIAKHQLQRKVNAPQRKPHQNKGTAIRKPPSPQNTNTTDRVTRSSINCPTTKNSEDAASHDSKNTKKKDRKAKTVKVRQRSASSQRSPPGDLSASSQPLTNKEKVFTKTTDDCTDQSQRNLRSRPCRSSPSSSSSQERDVRSHKSQTKPPKVIKSQQKPRTKTHSPMTTKAAPHKAAQPNRTRKRTARIKPFSEQDEDKWSEEELRKLHEAVSCHPKHITGYWTKVAMMVGTRSAEECHKRHTSMRIIKTPSKCQRKTKKEPLKKKADPVISARVGTLRRKQQVRDFLEAMPKEDMDDVFSSAYMQSKRIEVPSMCASDDHDFSVSDQEPLTPGPAGFPEAKTPQCLHITPGMMGSGSRNYDDKYVFQLQKRMKNHYQFNVEKHAKKIKATPASVKKTMRRCGNTENDTFVVWEMFPDKEEALADSSEEEDFYFSENE
ncbi:mis18-binding protein 1 [Eucyclogobius newberryi]|uniref:mis18-binding protein 1 n=1 Tax=Eucyclogobius newberryi TaxID=166745 RepID=UPI003B595E78